MYCYWAPEHEATEKNNNKLLIKASKYRARDCCNQIAELLHTLKGAVYKCTESNGGCEAFGTMRTLEAKKKGEITQSTLSWLQKLRNGKRKKSILKKGPQMCLETSIYLQYLGKWVFYETRALFTEFQREFHCAYLRIRAKRQAHGYSACPC